jgi:hypothetical protein
MMYRDDTDFDLFHFKKNELHCLLNLWACPNPHCNCTTIELEFLTEEQYKDEELNRKGIIVDFRNQEILSSNFDLTAEDEERNIGFVNIIENEFDKQDWQLIEKEFFFQKQIVIDNHLLGDDEPSDDFLFDLVHFDDEGLNVNFDEIFPHIKLFSVEIGIIKYRIVDSYCKKLN